ncbi:MAG: dTDP-4-dehydrorhamnose 3,5-epimerase [Hyphomonadaceae bacterium BRH_c29]|nr:MAG: dTDP-4-dehydrorhamnose 3,5-epimerase [Hyphomonadaceae bacterium BRH_c29]
MASDIEALAGFGDVLLIRPRRIQDIRGYFSETYRESELAAYGVPTRWVQENQSFSARRGTLRGMHFQKPPHAQAKLVRCITGTVLDVVVDLRPGSPAYGKHGSVQLSGENGLQIYVPAGFAHGFCTLTDDCRLLYKTSDYYAPAYDAGVAFDDSALGIEWPFSTGELVVSERDRNLPPLADLAGVFALEDGEA